jgi:hypothetical protein
VSDVGKGVFLLLANLMLLARARTSARGLSAFTPLLAAGRHTKTEASM